MKSGPFLTVYHGMSYMHFVRFALLPKIPESSLKLMKEANFQPILRECVAWLW